MAQQRFHNYQRALTSLDENHRLIGILEPGRYRGFDAMSGTGLSPVFEHSVNPASRTELNQSVKTGLGVALSRQGTVIVEDANITGLSVGSNSANGADRIDVLFMEHVFTEVAGGQAAIYGIVQGANGGPVEPALPNPEKQVKLGTITMPANASDITGAVYSPANPPGVGNQNVALIDFANEFTKQQRLNQHTSDLDVTVPGTNLGVINPQDHANFYNVNRNDVANLDMIKETRNGTILFLFFDQAITLRDKDVGRIMYNSEYASRKTEGYLPVALPYSIASWDLPANTAVMLYQVDDGDSEAPYYRLLNIPEDVLDKLVSMNDRLDTVEVQQSVNTSSISQKAASTQPAWSDINITAGNWATTAGTHDKAQYRKDTLGRVHIRGVVTRAQTGTDDTTPVTLATLPSGHRPLRTHEFVVPVDNIHDSSYLGRTAVIRINSSGQIIIDADDGAGGTLLKGARSWIMSGISFTVD